MTSDDLETVIWRLEDALEEWGKFIRPKVGGFIFRHVLFDTFGNLSNMLHEDDPMMRVEYLRRAFQDKWDGPKPVMEIAYQSMDAFYRINAELIAEGHLLAISEPKR